MHTNAQEQMLLLRSSLIDIAVESWRFSKVTLRMMRKMDAGDSNRYQSQLRWFLKKTEEALGNAALRIVNIEGQLFEPGDAVSAINIEDFDANDTLIIDQMVEPIIMEGDALVRTGTVILRRVEQ